MTDVLTKAKFRLFGLGLVAFLLTLITILASIIIITLFETKTTFNTLLITAVIISWFAIAVFFGGQCRGYYCSL